MWNAGEARAGLKNWFSSLRCGDSIELYAMAQYPGWQNFVECAEVEIHSAWVPADG